ncbi:MAG: hypothetical protein GX793_09300 [Bacteroidales bacterium]|jgi:hypothetical protein|nr:hypothetical protein [Bacteroidales bacterium]MCK9498655.1 hypothetical protein [Bacteroidales bacterium]MDY0314985.1 hypothetical protein [Bacteroidales bacterium]NLB87242.1 hypothetical protein [Bacteroidales bacterium]
MKTLSTLFIIFCLIFFSSLASANEMVLSGIYQGKNLYFLNPIIDENQEYCAYEIRVNGKLYDDVINSSTFGIYLDYLGLKFGQDFKIIIKHHENCYPKLINPEVLKPLSTFKITDTELTMNNNLVFKTENESGKLVFHVEEFRWGKWNEIKKIPGEGGPQNNEYSVKVYPFNGENKFRIYQMDDKYKKFYSNEMIFNVERENIKIKTNINKVKKEIEFSDFTRYAIIDEYGAELIAGQGKTINLAELKKGTYFLNYDNEYVLIRKK